MDDRPASGSDSSKTNLEVVVGTGKKKLTVDDLTEDFFIERTNRYRVCYSGKSYCCESVFFICPIAIP